MIISHDNAAQYRRRSQVLCPGSLSRHVRSLRGGEGTWDRCWHVCPVERVDGQNRRQVTGLGGNGVGETNSVQFIAILMHK